jgi:transcription elongation factor Elf1
MTKSKYKREQAAIDDKQQATLNPKSPTFIAEKQDQKTTIVQAHSGKYYCPFCFHKDDIGIYLISTKKGFHKSLGKCPECGNEMQIKTLTADMSIEQYAEFVFGYSKSGFWQKINFKKFNERLKAIGWSERFWLKYKQLKGDDTNETYEEMLYRSQEEDARAQGLIK